MQAPRRLASNKAGMMGYEDFVWFILSEEDKSKDISLEYWFKCCDLDCDGRLTPTEMLVSVACACCAALLRTVVVLNGTCQTCCSAQMHMVELCMSGATLTASCSSTFTDMPARRTHQAWKPPILGQHCAWWLQQLVYLQPYSTLNA